MRMQLKYYMLILLGFGIGILLTTTLFYIYPNRVTVRNNYTFVVDDTIINGVTGFQIDGRFYCVATAGRTMEQISTTDIHEKCHALTFANYTHFCTDEENLGKFGKDKILRGN